MSQAHLTEAAAVRQADQATRLIQQEATAPAAASAAVEAEAAAAASAEAEARAAEAAVHHQEDRKPEDRKI